MRILHVIPFFTPEMGGSAHVAYQMARHLGKRGDDVTVVASDYRIGATAFPPGPFKTVLLPAIAHWGFYVTPTLLPWAVHHLSLFDVIHMHTVRTFQNAVICHLARRRGIPYIVSAHGTLPIMVEHQIAKRCYDRLAGRTLLASAARLVAVSPVEAKQYRAAGIRPERVAVVNNGLDLEEFAHLPCRGTYRRQLGIPLTAPLILSLARLHRIKGLDHLIVAFGRIRCSLPNACLVVAGPDGGEMARLKELVEQAGLTQSVFFPGGLYEAARLAALVDADVVVAPSLYEIFGLVPLEALMCGVPAVVTAGSAAGQLLAEAGAAYTAPYGDIACLAETIIDVLTDRQEAGRRVAAGQAFVQARLDWNAVAKDLQALYQLARVEGHGQTQPGQRSDDVFAAPIA